MLSVSMSLLTLSKIMQASILEPSHKDWPWQVWFWQHLFHLSEKAVHKANAPRELLRPGCLCCKCSNLPASITGFTWVRASIISVGGLLSVNWKKIGCSPWSADCKSNWTYRFQSQRGDKSLQYNLSSISYKCSL